MGDEEENGKKNMAHMVPGRLVFFTADQVANIPNFTT
jgi:hypothetical protein